jgi:hypothetical protein
MIGNCKVKLCCIMAVFGMYHRLSPDFSKDLLSAFFQALTSTFHKSLSASWVYLSWGLPAFLHPVGFAVMILVWCSLALHPHHVACPSHIMAATFGSSKSLYAFHHICPYPIGTYFPQYQEPRRLTTLWASWPVTGIALPFFFFCLRFTHTE